MIEKFSYSTKKELKHYVYLLENPRTGTVFYIGKGLGDRVFDHAKAAIKDSYKQNLKLDIIRKLLKSGLKPDYEILRHGLSENEAFEVEAAAIDLKGLKDLQGNLVNGHDIYRGKMSINQIKIRYEPKKAPKIKEKVILININRKFLPNKSWGYYYQACRSSWRVRYERVAQSDYAFAVYQGVVYATVRIDKKSWRQIRRPDTKTKLRWEFRGQKEDNMENKYLHKFVGKHSQYPIRYKNV
jgi:hypothetical protein